MLVAFGDSGSLNAATGILTGNNLSQLTSQSLQEASHVDHVLNLVGAVLVPVQ